LGGNHGLKWDKRANTVIADSSKGSKSTAQSLTKIK
jgi:hypothetical protein